jgi:hypothetical protein
LSEELPVEDTHNEAEVFTTFPSTLDLRERLTKAAAHVGVSRSQLIRKLLVYGLNHFNLYTLSGPTRGKGKPTRRPRTNLDIGDVV